MRVDVFVFLQSFFALIWRFFSGWYIPGTNVTPAAFMLFLLFFALVLRLIRSLFGSSVGGGRD